MNTKTLRLFALVALVFGTPVFADAQLTGKIAVVDPQAVISRVDEWTDMARDAQADFQQKVAVLEAQKADFIKKRSASTQADAKELAKLQKDIEIEERALESEAQQAQQQLQASMMQRVDAGIKAVAEGKWDIVMPKVFYACKDCDITEQVIEQMNKEYKKNKAASKFKKS